MWTFRKRLDERQEHDQIGMLLNKVESHNPLFLVVASEEMRLFGDFERVDEQLAALSGHLEELFQQVLERVESDHGRDLVERALSLSECSRQGLLENETLELLRHPVGVTSYNHRKRV